MEEEDDVCDVCRSSETGPDDVMILCDACNVAVHAACYSITAIPGENVDWFCYPCRQAFKPSNLLCGLCNHSGGAFKCTNAEDASWVHCLCANWISELGEDPEQKKNFGPVVRLDRLDTMRRKVKCDVCLGKLAVQCRHSRCTTAIHPHCMMEEPRGFSWRVVELPDGTGYRREAYCRRHADDVGLPLKNEGELLIQVDPHAKFEWDDNYAPVLKEQYRNDPAYAHLVHAPTVFAAPAPAPVPPSKRGKVGRKRKATAALDEDRLHHLADNHGAVPSKRPKATVLSAVLLAAKMGTHAGGSSSASAKMGDRRAPSRTSSSGSSTGGMGALVVGTVPSRVPASAPSKTSRASAGPKEAAGKSRTAPATDGKPRKWSGGSTDPAGTASGGRLTRARIPASPSHVSWISQGDSSQDEEEENSASDAEVVEGRKSLFTSGYFSAKSVLGLPRGSQAPSKVSSKYATGDDTEADSDSSASSGDATRRRSNAASAKVTTSSSSSAGSSFGNLAAKTVGKGGGVRSKSLTLTASSPCSASEPLSLPPSTAHTRSRLSALPARENAGHDLSPDVAQTASSGRVSEGAAGTARAGTAAAQSTGTGAVGEDGSVSLRIDLHTLEVLRRALQISAPAPALPPLVSASTSSAGAAGSSFAVAHSAPPAQPSTSSSAARPAMSPSQYRVSSAPSDLQQQQWAALAKAGWICLRSGANAAAATTGTSSSSSSSSSEGSAVEEVFIAPGVITVTDAEIQTFDRTRYVEGVQYFGSADAMRTHVAQNPCLLQEWRLTWHTLHFQHGWRAALDSSAAAANPPQGSGAYPRVSEQDVGFYYLARLVDGVGENEDSGDESAAPLSQRGNYLDGVHVFRRKDMPAYIHRFPFLLQNDATLTNTLLRYGWKHRLAIKPERPAGAAGRQRSDDTDSDDAGEGGAALGRSYREFLWQSAHIMMHLLPERTRAELEDRQVGDAAPAEGVWLDLPTLRQHLWVEPHRLFQPTDRTLSQLRIAGESAATGSHSSGCAEAAVDVTALRAQLVYQTNLAQESEDRRATLAQQNAGLAADKRRLEAKLARIEERRRKKKEAKRLQQTNRDAF